MKIKAGIIGGAGYTGGELIRLLIHHPDVSLDAVHSRSNAGKALHSIHRDLLGETDIVFTNDLSFISKSKVDVVFLCLGHGESKKFLAENNVPSAVRIIDLANDFRLPTQSKSGKRHFVYGLPELNREEIKKAHNVANPGCFATAIQLGLLPLAKAGLLEDVFTTGITGSTGAGQGLSDTAHYSWRANNIQAYKTLTHQHLGEIYASLHQLQSSFPAQQAAKGVGVHFVPWRGNFTRGIFISSQLHCKKKLAGLVSLYEKFYSGHPFTLISYEPVFLKQVLNTNKCIIQLESAGDIVVIHSVIDNLLKGASGQAVQNMNLMFGLEESAGLQLKSGYF